MTGDRAEAEDLAQETFVKAFRNLAAFDTSRRLSSWLFRIAHNTTLDALRKVRPLVISLDARAAPQTALEPAELSRQLGAYLDRLASTDEFAGVVLVAHDGTPIFEKGYGPGDRNRHTRITPGLRFNVASIGKAFTKVAIGQLVVAGKLSRADTIGKLLPDYPNAAAYGTLAANLCLLTLNLRPLTCSRASARRLVFASTGSRTSEI